jgi:hypothetical protein
MTALDDFTLKTINRNTKRPGISANSNRHYSIIYNIDKNVYIDILKFIEEEYDKNPLYKEDAELTRTVLKIHSMFEMGRDKREIYNFAIIKAERKYCFDLNTVNKFKENRVASLLDKSLKVIDRKTIEVNYNLWKFTLLIDGSVFDEKTEKLVVAKSQYDPGTNLLYFEPLFVPPYPSVDPLSAKEKTKKIFKYKKSNPCPCLNSSQTYEECCYTLFFDPKFKRNPHVFGFIYLDFQKEINKVLSEKSEVGGYDLKDITTFISNNKENLTSMFQKLANEKLLIPSLGFAKGKVVDGIGVMDEEVKDTFSDMADDLIKDYPQDNIIWTIRDSHNIIMKSASSKEELEILIQEKVSLLLLEEFLKVVDATFEFILDNNNIPDADLYREIDSWAAVFGTKNTVAIKTSISLYKKKQFDAAIHLVVPYIESILRHIAIVHTSADVDITYPVTETHSRKYTYLGDLINGVVGYESSEMDDNAKIGRRIATTYFHQLLTRNGGFYNIRNELSHKFENIEFGKFEFRLSFHLLVILTQLFTVITKEKAK